MTMIASMVPNTSSASLGSARKVWVEGIRNALKRWLVALRTWRAEQSAINRLQSMSDRQLKDIGISRSEVGTAARDGTARHAVYHHYY
jgi:uncharacterized protein YjiS (DUF1127 family)